MIIWRIFAGLAGLAVMGAATHANVIHAGGYGSSDANLIIAIAGLVAIGTGFAALVWHHSTKVGAVALGLCLIAGEAYWTATNTERELQTRATAEAPTIKARAIRAELKRQVAEAEKEKTKADDEALKQAPLPGCRKECAQLLRDAKRDAETTLTAKRAELEGLPEEKITDALPDHLGVAHWVWDLIMAGLRSLGTMGGPIGIALAIHPKRPAKTPIAVPIIDITPQPVPARPRPRLATSSRQPIGAVLDFLHDGLEIITGPRLEMADAYAAYAAWCKSKALRAMDVAEFVEAMEKLCGDFSIPIVAEKGRDYLLNVRVVSATPRRLGWMAKRDKP